ncbi:MAG: exodeoxyribonuclease VII small subunit [Lachnospiraceae bacterium]|nr:exodeoxyribonuclease VII small subunit [Lachnospiraceae bacterium]
MAKENKTIDELFTELDTILSQLEGEEVSLEDSFRLYQKGMYLVKECNQSIDKVEKDLIVISEELSDGV